MANLVSYLKKTRNNPRIRNDTSEKTLDFSLKNIAIVSAAATALFISSFKPNLDYLELSFKHAAPHTTHIERKTEIPEEEIKIPIPDYANPYLNIGLSETIQFPTIASLLAQHKDISYIADNSYPDLQQWTKQHNFAYISLDEHIDSLCNKKIEEWTSKNQITEIKKKLTYLSTYREYIEAGLKKYTNLDPHLIYAIPVHESGANNDINVESIKGAAGLWQLMERTGKGLGLLINDYIDERYDPKKSTDAAIKHIQKLSKMFPESNYLITMAYNWGEGNLESHLEKHGLSTEMFENLPSETKKHTIEILAIKKLLDSGLEYETNKLTHKKRIDRSTILEIEEEQTLYELSERLGIHYANLTVLNPQIHPDMPLPKGTIINYTPISKALNN